MMPSMKVSEDNEPAAEQAAPPKVEVASTVNKIIEEQQAEQQEEEKEREDDNFSDINDDELDMYLASEDEVKVKTIIWSQLNKDFLEAEAGTYKYIIFINIGLIILFILSYWIFLFRKVEFKSFFKTILSVFYYDWLVIY